jgi:anaerobic carbon-monoxide dehydrogenase iron sulfur subunit
MKQIFVTPEKCMACRSCEITCAVQHSEEKNLFSAVLQSPAPKKRLFVEQADGISMPVVCRHCEEAPCLSACISGCLFRDDKGLVRRKKERCIGCWSCVMACPFGVVTEDREQRLAVKCDRCHKLETPACVHACPTGALIFAAGKDISREKRRKVILSETGAP